MADWWDAVELWLTQLPVVFQVVLAALVVMPLCWGAAAGLDRLVDRAVAVLGARAERRRARLFSRR